MPHDPSMLLGLALAALWTMMALLCGTAVVALGTASRTRLVEALKRANRAAWVQKFDQHHHHYGLTAQVYRQLAVVLFVLTVEMMLAPTSPWPIKTLKVLVIAVVWFLVVGVAIPSAWARYAGETYLAGMAGVFEALRRVTKPVLVVLDAVDEIVRRLAGASGQAADRAEAMEQEILDAVSEAEVGGAVDKAARAMIKSVMVLDETSAGEIMTPRTEMIGIEANADFERVRQVALEAGHSRIPVYEGTMDHVVGVLYARDLLRVNSPASFSLKETMRKATFVPETKDLASLLREFQANRVHIAVVLDEYGGTAGLVTIEDILEEVVGEIEDEHDEPPVPPIRRIEAGVAEVDARMRVEDVNEHLDIRLPEDESYDTIGGYVFSKLGRVPLAGESTVEGEVKVEVVQADARRIHRLRVYLLNATEQE